MNEHERALDGKCLAACRECAIEAAFNRGYNLGRTDQQNASPPPKAKQYRDALKAVLPYAETCVEDLGHTLDSIKEGEFVTEQAISEVEADVKKGIDALKQAEAVLR